MSSHGNDGKRISTAAAVGIGVAATIGALLFVGLLGGCCWRRKARIRATQHGQDEVPLSPQPDGAHVHRSGEDQDPKSSLQETSTEHPSSALYDQGMSKRILMGTVDAWSPTADGRALAEATTNMAGGMTIGPRTAGIVYVPAYELPTYPNQIVPQSELSATSVTASSPSELPSPKQSVPRSRFNPSWGPVANMSGATESSRTCQNSRVASEGFLSALSESGTDAGANGAFLVAETSHSRCKAL